MTRPRTYQRNLLVYSACAGSLALGVASVYLFPSGDFTKREEPTPGSPDRAEAMAPLYTPQSQQAVLSPNVQPSATASNRREPRSAPVHAKVAAIVAAEGPTRAANQIAHSFGKSPGEQRVALEGLTAAWAETDPAAAVGWLASNSSRPESRSRSLSPGLWDAAVGGYIEGVLENDPESAVIAADLLEPQTPPSVENPQNRSAGGGRLQAPVTSPPPGDEPEDDVSVETEDPVPDETSSHETDLPAPTDGGGERFAGDPGFPGDPDFLTGRQDR